MLVGYDPSTKDLKAVEYAPLTGEDWKVSTPAEQDLDMMFATEVGYNVANLETIYGLLGSRVFNDFTGDKLDE